MFTRQNDVQSSSSGADVLVALGAASFVFADAGLSGEGEGVLLDVLTAGGFGLAFSTGCRFSVETAAGADQLEAEPTLNDATVWTSSWAWPRKLLAAAAISSTMAAFC